MEGNYLCEFWVADTNLHILNFTVDCFVDSPNLNKWIQAREKAILILTVHCQSEMFLTFDQSEMFLTFELNETLHTMGHQYLSNGEVIYETDYHEVFS